MYFLPLRLFCTALAMLLALPRIRAQQITEPDTISMSSVQHYMQVLAGDSLEGRGNLQPALIKAGVFIGERFRSFGLKPYVGVTSYYHSFQPVGGPNDVEPDALWWNGKKKKAAEFLWLNDQPGMYPALSLEQFTVVRVDSFLSNALLNLPPGNSPVCIWTSDRLAKKEWVSDLVFEAVPEALHRPVLLVVATDTPVSLRLKGNAHYYEQTEYNVVGVLPGRSKANEYVYITAHYDHEGTVIGNRKRDLILNGANDDASGTTAVLALAEWFSRNPVNERTLVFVAFAGEELGLLGSYNFTRNPELKFAKADINLEMLGIPEFGKATVMVTGKNRSWLHEALEKELDTAGLQLIDDPYPDRDLYERSDNYSFVEHHVAAHTIMASTDNDPCYHQPCDQLDRIDFNNLAVLINGIRVAVTALVNQEKL